MRPETQDRAFEVRAYLCPNARNNTAECPVIFALDNEGENMTILITMLTLGNHHERRQLGFAR
jgi:hypothetical protein